MTILDLACEPQHISTLAAWHHQQWQALNPGDTLELRIARMQSYLDDNLLPSTFICLKDQQLTGSAALVKSDMDSHSELTPWLASVFVAPDFRRRGIGSKLVEHVMQRARQAGIARLYLFTPDHAEFYRRLGWSSIAEEHYRGLQVSLMSVSLMETA